MIVTEGFDEVLDLGRVYANGLHSLRLFRIRNRQSYAVEVRLQSDLDGQIAFQTSNENLNLLLSALREHVTLNSSQVLNWTTNTVDATEKSINILGDDAAERQFNLLFNYVNTVKNIVLAPYECRDLVLSFLPADVPDKIPTIHRHVEEDTDDLRRDKLDTRHDQLSDDLMASSDQQQSRYQMPRKDNYDSDHTGSGTATDVPNINGHFHDNKHHRTNRTFTNTTSPPEAQTFDQEESFFYHDVQGSIYFLVYPLEQNGITRSVDAVSTQMDRRISVAPPAFVKSVHVSARVCRSFLWSDISGTVLSLPDGIPGETHVKDFTVWNRSEIDLYYRLDATQIGATSRRATDELSFIDADTGDPVGQRPIPGFGHRRLRATFCPNNVGTFAFDIRLENENDAYNSEEARIQAVVKSLAGSASLVVNEEALDFGVCYSGHGYSRTFVVKNVSELPVEVHLQAQDANIRFYPVIDQYNGSNGGSGGQRDTTSNLHGDMDLMGGSTLPHSHTSNSNTMNTTMTTSNTMNTSTVNNSISSGKGNTGNTIRSPPPMEPIEELLVKPGVERTIMATYTPRLDASSTDYQAGRLLRRTFRIQLSISSSAPGFSVPKAYKVIQCRAKACTSFIGTSTSIVNFGDTDVGVLKSLPLIITNYSELPAQVQIRFASKILTCDRQQISIPPKQSQEVKFEIYPRKVNPEYRKQIEIVNLNHRQDNQIVEVKSTNVDRKGVSFHSLFYRVITAPGINYLDFGTVIGGASAVRTMMIDNISGEELVLNLSTSDSEHIQVFTVADDMPDQFQSLIDTLEPSLLPQSTNALVRTSSPTSLDHTANTATATTTATTTAATTAATTTQQQHSSVSEFRSTIAALRNHSTLPVPQPIMTSASSTAEDTRRSTRLDYQPVETLDFLDLALPVILGRKSQRRLRRRMADQGRRIAGVRPQNQGISTTFNDMILNSTAFTSTATANAATRHRTREERPMTTTVASNIDQNASSTPLLASAIVAQTIASTTMPTTTGSTATTTTGTATGSTATSNTGNTIGNIEANTTSNTTLDYANESSITAERELNAAAPPVFPSQLAEESFVQEQMALRSQLRKYIDDHRLVSITANLIVNASSKRRLMVLYEPIAPSSRNDTTTLNNPRVDILEHVNIRLVKFNKDTVEPCNESIKGLNDEDFAIPVRQVSLKARLRQIHWEIGQRSINLGPIGKEERRTNVITIRNRGEVPLLYTLKKSGSVLSSDISFRSGGQSGVVRGFSIREVEFVYQPSLSGDFSEKIIVENVLDPSNNGAVLVKAFVRKPTHFYVKPTEIDLGPCLLGGETASICSALMITNTDYQTRTFVAKVERIRYKEFTGEIKFRIERSDGSLDGTGALLSEDAQEKIESLEQKMKIARRKGRSDKVKKLEDKLDRLRRGTPDEPDVGQDLEEDELDGEEEVDTTPTTNKLNTNDSNDVDTDTPITDIIDEAPIKVIKVAPESITFSLNGRTTEKLWITLSTTPLVDTVTDDESVQDTPTNTLEMEQKVTGMITVHEHKNADVSQQITFMAQVFRQLSDYQVALTAWRMMYPRAIDDILSDTDSISTALSQPQLLENTSNVISNNHMNMNMNSIGPLVDTTSNTNTNTNTATTSISNTPTTTHPSKSPLLVDGMNTTTYSTHILVHPTKLLSAIKCGDTTAYTIYLTNSTDSVKSISIQWPSSTSAMTITPLLEVDDPSTVQLDINEKRSITFNVHVSTLGWHISTITLFDQEDQWTESIGVQCYAHMERLLYFPSLARQHTTGNTNIVGKEDALSLDLGFCYVDGNKYAQIVPLMVASHANDELLLSCQSNLSQVLVFLDSHGTRPATQVPIKANGVITLWIAVQPTLTTTNRGESRDRDGDIRRLIGGLRFTLTTNCMLNEDDDEDGGGGEEEQSLSLGSQILRFTASIGRSMLKLSHRIIYLGWTSVLDEHFYGHLSVINASARVPAAYRLDCSGGSLSLDRSSGTLAVEGSNSPSEAMIHFRMNSSRYGLLTEMISVTNVHNPQQVLEAKVQLLVDDERLMMRLDQHESSTEMNDQSDNDRLYTLPQLTWDCMPVIVSEVATSIDGVTKKRVQWILKEKEGEGEGEGDEEEERKDNDHTGIRDQKIQLENMTDQPIVFTATSDLNQAIRWTGSVVSNNHNGDGEEVDGDYWLLPPRRVSTLVVSCVDPSRWIDSTKNLERGEQVTVTGLLQIRDIEHNRVLKALTVHMPFGVSRGQIKEPEIDLGQVGYVNSWQSVRASGQLTNLSPLPLRYAIESPPFITPINDGDTDEVIDPFGHRELVFELQPDQLKDSLAGEARYEIRIHNLQNPANTMSIWIRVDMTTFDLRFERLHNNDELLLPSLQYPTITASVPCDAWFKVINTSAQDIRFDIGTEKSTQVDDFVRLDVLSRFSNSPLKGGVSLSPNGSIEVRVVASLRPGVRLPSEMRSIIVRQTPIILGKIWVTTQPASSDTTTTRLTEDITVRGSITETCAFSIVEKVTQLSLLMSDDPSSRLNETTSAQFAIHNLSKDLDFSFRMVLENPPGIPLSQLLLIDPPLLEEEDVGSVRPEEQLTFRCWLRSSTKHRLPDAIRICIVDMHALTEQSLILTLRVPAMAKRSVPNTAANTTTTTPASPSVASSSSSMTNIATSNSTINNTSGISSTLSGSFRTSPLLPPPSTPAPPVLTSSVTSSLIIPSTSSVSTTTTSAAIAIATASTRSTSSIPPMLSASTSPTSPLLLLSSSPSSSPSLSSTPLTTPIPFYANSPLIRDEESPSEQQQQQAESRHMPAYLTIRGCRRIDEDPNRFELDLGQLNVGSPAVVKSMVLTRSTASMSTGQPFFTDGIPYTLCIIPASSASWLSVNRTRGRLGASSHYYDASTSTSHDEENNEQTLTITAIPGEISVFTAHIVIESSRDPTHRIMIRVNMEVVAKQNLLRSTILPSQRFSNSIFSVSASCLQGGEGLIDMPHVTFNSEYVMRSIMIRNHDAVTLPFTVTTDLGSDPSDVVFSTSRTSAKLFSTLYVDGGHTTRVYIRFRPLPATKTVSPTSTSTTATSNGQISHSSHQDNDAVMTLPAEQKLIRIYVGCRLVKDYQFVVNLKANCWWPTFSIDKDVVDFRGVSVQESSGFDISLESDHDILTVTNLTGQLTAFTVINDSTFFDVEPASECIQLSGQSSTIIVIRPRLDGLKKYMKTIRREKYICEVISLYNVDRPEERHWITLRITLDQSRYVQAIAVTHITLAYDIMEKRIAEFHSLLGQQRKLTSINNDTFISGTPITSTGIHHLLMTSSVFGAPLPLNQIPFAFRYIIDQLSYYCTIKTGGRFFQLACLFFSLLLHPLTNCHESDELIERWQCGLSDFLSIFPETNEKLQDLHRMLETSTGNTANTTNTNTTTSTSTSTTTATTSTTANNINIATNITTNNLVRES
ncbi:hypothetical protein BDF19DRAFT_464050 [Syncephalis fuscata]|nr:hypothetical protein BDF19DRAFT_464050 [Syncephalis fuscata]